MQQCAISNVRRKCNAIVLYVAETALSVLEAHLTEWRMSASAAADAKCAMVMMSAWPMRGPVPLLP